MSDFLKIDSFFQEYLKVTGKRWDYVPHAERQMREDKWPDGYIWFTTPVNDNVEVKLSPYHTGAKGSDGKEVTQTITTRGETEWLCCYLHTGPEVSPETHLLGMPTRDSIYLMGETGCGTNGKIALGEVCEELFANRKAGIMSFPFDVADYNAMNVSERRLIGGRTPWLDSIYVQENKFMTVKGRYIADRGNVLECALWTKEPVSVGRDGKFTETAECHEVWPEFIIPFEDTQICVEFGDNYDGTREHPYKIVLP